MAQWLVRRTLDREVWVRARVIVLCSCRGRHFTLTVPLSTQEYKWVRANCQGNLTKCWGVTCDWLASHPRGVAILLVASCYRNQDELRQLCKSGLWLNLFCHCNSYNNIPNNVKTITNASLTKLHLGSCLIGVKTITRKCSLGRFKGGVAV